MFYTLVIVIFIFSCLTIGFAQDSNNLGLIITEIMYDPKDIHDSKGEYIELCFLSEEEFFNLSKCSFEGITFTFPDNTYINSSDCFVIARKVPQNETDFNSFLYYFNNSEIINNKTINNRTINELFEKNLFEFNGSLNNNGMTFNLSCQNEYIIQINYTNTIANNNGKSINYYCNKNEEQDPNPFYYNFNRKCSFKDENSLPEINLNQNDYNISVNESIEINFSVLDTDNDVLWIQLVNLSDKAIIKKIDQSNYQITFESEDEGVFIFQIRVSDSINKTEEIISINVTLNSVDNNDQEESEENNNSETQEDNNNEYLEEDDPCEIKIENIQVTDNKVEYYIKSKNNQAYEYWIEDIYETIIKSKSESSTSTKKSYTDSKNNLYVIINARSKYDSSCEIKREIIKLNVKLNRDVNFEIDDLSYKKLIVSISISNMATKINFDCYLNNKKIYSNEFKPENLISYSNKIEIDLPQQIIKNGENNVKCVLNSEKDYIEKHDFFIYSIQTNNQENTELKSEENKVITSENYCSWDYLSNNNYFSFYTMEKNLKEENTFYFNPKKDFDFDKNNISLIILENKLNIKINNDSKQDFKIKINDEDTILYAFLLEDNTLISSIKYNVSLKNQNNLSKDPDQITEEINSNEEIKDTVLSSINTNNVSLNPKTTETSQTQLNNNEINKQMLTGELFSFELNEKNNENKILIKFSSFILIFVIFSAVFYKNFNRLKMKKQNSNLNKQEENKPS